MADGLKARGKLVGANIVPYYVADGYYPQIVTEQAKLNYPFSEIFATEWNHTATTTTNGDMNITKDLLTFMDWCETAGVHSIVNVYSNDINIIRYGLAMYIMAAGKNTYFSAMCPPPDGSDEYSLVPAWIAEMDQPLGDPLEDRQLHGAVYSRHFANIYSVADTAGGIGTFQGTPPAPPTAPVQPARLIFSDNFARADTAEWGSLWTLGYNSTGAGAATASNMGILKTGSINPGMVTRRYIGGMISDFEVLYQFMVDDNGVMPTLMFRAAQQDVDGVSAYGLHTWDDRLELVSFDASWSAAVLMTTMFSRMASNSYWVRCIARGGSLQAKIWDAESVEPANWQIMTTDGSYATGYFGFMAATSAPGKNFMLQSVYVGQGQ